MKIFIERSLALLRSIVATMLFPVTIIIIGPLAMAGHYLFYSRKLDDYFVSLWGRLCCRMSGVRVVIEGKENIPKEGCLFLFNHASFFDVFALAGYLPGVRFGSKAELFKIPIFGATIRAMGTLPIARDNRDEVYKIYEEAKVRFANGEKFALSPEGGRFYGEKLSRFKAGPFVFAISAGAPIVPVVVTGAYAALPKGSVLFNRKRLFHTINLKILKPVTTQNLTLDDRKELQNVIYNRMNSVWLSKKEFVGLT